MHERFLEIVVEQNIKDKVERQGEEKKHVGDLNDGKTFSVGEAENLERVVGLFVQ